MIRDSDTQKLIHRFVTVTVTVAETDADGRVMDKTLVGLSATRTLDQREVEQYHGNAFQSVAAEALCSLTDKSLMEHLARQFAGKVTA